MVGVGKYFDKKPVLKDIYLSYFYGAKIGVLGLNGSGKSSLLRIMAGADKEFVGEAVLSPAYTVGFLEQEPKLDPAKTVRQVVEEGVQEIVDLLKEYNKINDSFASPLSDDEMNKLIEHQGEVQEKLDHTNAWELDSPARDGHGRPALSTRRQAREGPLRWREAARRIVPFTAPEAGHTSSRRAYEPSGRRVRCLAGASSPKIRGHGNCRDP